MHISDYIPFKIRKCLYFLDLTQFRGYCRNPRNNFEAFLENLRRHIFVLRLYDLKEDIFLTFYKNDWSKCKITTSKLKFQIWLSTSAKSIVLKKVDAIWQTNLGSLLPCLTGLNIIHRRWCYTLQHCVFNNRIDFLSVSRLPRNNLTFQMTWIR